MARQEIELSKVKRGMVVAWDGTPNVVTSKVVPYVYANSQKIFSAHPHGSRTAYAGDKFTLYTEKDRAEALKKIRVQEAYIGAVGSMGADPEIFAVDGRGCVIPAWQWLPEDKGSPEAIFWDGFQAEFRVISGSCLEERGKSISNQLARVQNSLHAKFPNGKLTMKSVMRISDKMLTEADERHVALGCKPSVNAQGMHGERVEDGRCLRHRFAGGHVHVGVDKRDNDIEKIIRFLDATLGVIGVSLFEGYEDPIRRRYYGLPGEHRVKPYGFEYRTLPNTWICHPTIYMLVFELTRFFVALSACDLDDIWEADHGEVIRCLMNSDVKLARKILRQNRELIAGFFNCRWGGYGTCLYEALHKGVDGIVKDPEDVVNNWRMKFGGWPMYIRNAKDKIRAGVKI